jgi:hypothetical protein
MSQSLSWFVISFGINSWQQMKDSKTGKLHMSKGISPKSPKRRYPPFWEKFIPAAVLIISAIIAFLVFVTIRVALGLPALPL